MATVSASLRMFDQMTRPLEQVTSALNLTISAMDDLNNSANKDIKITNSLNAAKGVLQRASSGLHELTQAQDNATNAQNKLNNSFNKGTNKVNGLMDKVKNLAGAYLGFQAVKKGIDLTIGGAARLEQQLITISGMLGNKDVGKAFFGKINDYALISQYGLKDFAAISRQFIQFTKNTDKLMDLNKLAERLAFLDPTQGLEGAGFALKEILGGDGMSLKGRFGFGSGEIKQLKEASSMDDFMKKFDKMLNKKGGTQLAVEEAAGAAISLWDNLMANITTSFGQTGNSALEVMKPALRELNEAFKEGKFQPFFNSIGAGLAIIGRGILFILDIISWTGGFIQENWSIIEPILIATILYFSAMLIPVLWDAITTLVAMSIAWVMVNWPILLIIGSIALFIYILTKCGITTEQVLGFIGGIFGVTFGFIYNLVALLWNAFASFAEFLGNVLNHPLYSIKRLFFNIWNSIVEFVGGALDAIVGMVKKVPFLKDLVGDFSFVNTFSADAGKPPEDYWTAPRMEAKDYANEFKYGYGKGAGIAKSFGDMNLGNTPKVPNLDAWNKAQGPGTLSTMDPDSKKHLKNIDNKIDVSNEHLKMLRDVADRDYIAKYNTTTLAPNVKVEFGDVKETADANKIAGIITKIMKEEIAALPEGV